MTNQSFTSSQIDATAWTVSTKQRNVIQAPQTK